jgi:hypothetical protein
MAPDRLTTLNGARRLGRPAEHLSFGAALVLFAIAAVVWLVTTQPTSILGLPAGPDPGRSGEQAAVFISTIYGAVVLAAGLFAILLYAVHWPAIANRETHAALVQLRAELYTAQVEKDRLLAKLARLRALRAEIASYEAQVPHARKPWASDAGQAVRSGRDIMDDIISELAST